MFDYMFKKQVNRIEKKLDLLIKWVFNYQGANKYHWDKLKELEVEKKNGE